MRVRASLLLPLAALATAILAQSPSGTALAQGSGAGLHAALADAAVELAAKVAPARAADPAPARGEVLGAAARSPRPLLHRVAIVRAQVAVSERPGGPASASVGPTTEFGSTRVLGVAARRGDWLGVLTTGRPNGRLAWLRRDGVQMRRTRWSLHADLSERSLELRSGDRVVRRLTVAIGRPGSDTPTGRFAVTDKLSGSRFGGYYGCCILALNGTQPNLPAGWSGGNRLAIHGTDSPSTIGMAASAGCLRAGDDDLRVLMAKVPLGTPVFVRD